MIASIEGIVEDKSVEYLVVNVHGVGYEVFTNNVLMASLATGQTTRLLIHEQIKEDAHDLYGFAASEDKQLFEKLLSVKNVGPRVAMAVLNIGSSEVVRQAIAGGDTKLLQNAKGVGRRASEQIVVELRDKVGLASSSAAEAIVGRGSESENDEAVQALVSLGFSLFDARIALTDIDPSLAVEARITQALKVRK